MKAWGSSLKAKRQASKPRDRLAERLANKLQMPVALEGWKAPVSQNPHLNRAETAVKVRLLAKPAQVKSLALATEPAETPCQT